MKKEQKRVDGEKCLDNIIIQQPYHKQSDGKFWSCFLFESLRPT